MKALAALQGKTIKQYALERLFPDVASADLVWGELKILLGSRIVDGLACNVSTKSFGQTLDEELAGDCTWRSISLRRFYGRG
ncbi:antitoxin [Brucella lupini]|uniref:antitoxin n=1 Tax=Brucella lupini TaxID=255457 RepID=UPI002287020E|nr:antitoxin [Brucella lupini]